MEEPFQIPLGEKNNRKGFFTLLHDFFIVRKMGGIWGLFFFGAAAIFFSLVVSKLGLVPGILILLMLIGLPVVLALIFYPKFGVVTFIVAAYLIMYVGRMNITDFPLGTLMDGMELLLFLGIFVQQKT